MKVSYYHDASHGWYRISMKALENLGIESAISPWSYIHGTSVYLEEDSDAGILFDTLKQNGIVPRIHRCKQESRSRVRSFQSYKYSSSAR